APGRQAVDELGGVRAAGPDDRDLHSHEPGSYAACRARVRKLSYRKGGALTRPALLALDGGGSKVDAALVTAAGEVLGAARWSGGMLQGPADWGDGHEIGLGPAVEAVCGQAGLDPARLPIADLGVYCLAGADFPEDYRRIQRSLAGRRWAPATVLQNDT